MKISTGNAMHFCGYELNYIIYTMKLCNILKVKNILVKSVNYVTGYKFAVLLLFIFYH
jgi:hypothetical protein